MHSLGAYFRVLWAGRTWRAYIYLLLGLPLGILWGTYTITMLAIGIPLVIIWVGVPLLIGLMVSLRPIGASERGLANGLLAAGIEPPEPRTPREADSETRLKSSMWRWGREVLRDEHAWRTAAWNGMRLVLGPIGFAVGLIGVVVPLAILLALVQASTYALGWGDWMTDAESVEVVNIVTFWVLVGSPVLIFLMPMFAWASRGVAAAHVPLARWALGPCAHEREVKATARAELAEEQVRIDQELHDSIGHMITMNIVQAGAGAHVFDSDPEFARQALRNIEERGRAAMGELDRIIAAIRGGGPESRTPLKGMADIPALVETSRAAGMTVAASLDLPDAPAAVGRAAFCVVREALTNAAKHAPGAAVEVTVGRDGDAVGVAVINGPGAQAPVDAGHQDAARHGLAGIRDRVALLGGTSRCGPEGDGYAVRALVPLEMQLDGSGPADSPWAGLRGKVTA